MQKTYRDGAAFLTLQIAGDVADIVDIEVPPAQRRQGIATRLLQQAMADLTAQGVPQLFLEVRQSNAPALALYRKLGATQIGIRPAYYRHPVEDAVLMTISTCMI